MIAANIIVIVLIIVILGITFYDCYKHHKENKFETISFRESFDLTEMPIVSFQNNGKTLNFLLDTGSTISHIDKSVIDSLEFIKLKKKAIVTGLEGITAQNKSVRMNIEYKGKPYGETFSVSDLSGPFNQIKKESGVNLHGILGTSFFNTYKYVVDFKEFIAYSKMKLK